jgi:hypothetical protein
MMKLFKIELVKILNYTSFRVILILHFLLFLLVVFVSTQIDISVPGFTTKNLFQFPHVWESFAWIASWFNLLLAILLIVLVGNEYSYKTFRQQVITGLSRNDLIIGKNLVIGIVALYGVLLVLFTSTVFGLIFTRGLSLSTVFEKSYILIVYFIQAIGYMTLGLLITVIFRNTALSIVMFLLYFLLIEPIIRLLFPRDIRLYFPVKIISNLTPRPEFLTITSNESMVDASGQSNLDLNAIGIAPDPLPEYLTILLALVYIATFSVLIFVIVRKRDI